MCHPHDFAIAEVADSHRGVPVSLLSRTTGGTLERSARYRQLLRPQGLRHEVRVVFRAGAFVWGGMALVRDEREPDFTQEEVDLLAGVSVPLAEALRRRLLAGPASSAGRDAGPAVLVLSADDRVVSCTDASENLLGELADVGLRDPEGLPGVIRAVAKRARWPLRSRRSATARVCTRLGRWLTVRAAALDGGQRVAVVIQPIAPSEAAAMLLAAHGLSARELTIAQHVLHGLSTEDIGKVLTISEYTVQDHLKSIFDKTGVSSRKELAARLFFADHRAGIA